jgi:hypothetical protein
MQIEVDFRKQIMNRVKLFGRKISGTFRPRLLWDLGRPTKEEEEKNYHGWELLQLRYQGFGVVVEFSLK